MKWVSHSLNMLLLLDSVLGTLPTPCNLSVNSVNFLHILHWDPGPATPPGVRYKVFSRLSGEKKKKAQNDNTTTATWLQLKLNNYKYYLTVQALNNGTWSPESEEVFFTPIEQTMIGPPNVTVTECGNGIKINISLPEADKSSEIPNNDIRTFYKARFKVLLKESNKIKEVHKTEDKSVIIDNLEKGKKYCIQIQTEITMNKHTEPSTWVCIFTSITDTSRVPVLRTAAGLLICCIGALMTLTYGLYYTGFLFTLQATLPRALIMALKNAKLLPVEKTNLDTISVCSDKFKQKKYTITTALYPIHRSTCSGTDEEEEDEAEEENERSNLYINRNAENSLMGCSCHYSCDVLRTSMTVRSHAVADRSDFSSEIVPAELDQLKTRGENDHLFSQQPEMEVKKQSIFVLEEEMNENCVNMSENVDLSSVALTAIALSEKELYAEEPLTLTATKHFFFYSDMLTDSDDLTSTKCTCFEETCNECGCDDVETQKMEEEQFFGYVGR